MVKKTMIIISVLLVLLTFFGCQQNTDEPIETNADVGSFERLFDTITYRKITIHITQDNWDTLQDNMRHQYDQYGNLKTDEYVVADVTYEDNQGTLNIPNVGLRPRGNLSLTTLMNEDDDINMNHFKIKFNEDFDGTYPNNDGRRGFDLKELNMKWNRNYDETYLTEPYAFMMMNHFGVYAPYSTHFVLSLNIEGIETMMGLYIGFEPIDDEFIERRFSKNENDGDLYKCLWQQYEPASLEPITNMASIGIRDVSRNYFPTYDLKTNKTSSNHSALLSFIDDINTLEQPAFNTYIEQYFDVDMFLRLLAVNVFIGNPDDYRAMGNNYYLYQNSETQKWMMIPYDFDHGLGQGWFESQVYPNYSIGVDIYEWFDLDSYLMGQEVKEPLVDKLLEQDIYKDRYLAFIEEILNDTFFTTDYFNQIYEALREAFEGTYDEAIDHQGFGLRDVFGYMNAKREDITNQLSQT